MADNNNSEIATDFLTMVAAGKVRDAYARYIAESFEHHNVYFPCDRQSLLHAMEHSASAEPNKSFTVKQVIASGDRVAVFSQLKRTDSALEYAVVHILRFDEGKIVEMWDIGQEIPKDSPNELGMF